MWMLESSTRRRCCWSLLLIGMFAWGRPSDCVQGDEPPVESSVAQQDASSAQQRALLVGCTRYANLNGFRQLRGPINDVHMLQQLLTERFGFPEDNIAIMTEEDGPRPTREAIVAAFQALIEQTGPSDQVVILLAGHGSQQVNDSADDFESDGLDEVFCPRDIGRLESNESGQITNGITDDEISDWLEQLMAKGADVLFLVDACHSGTMTRGGNEVPRGIPPEALVDRQQIDEARQQVALQEAPSDSVLEHTLVDEASLEQHTSGSLVALYAAQPDEPEYEKRLPLGEDDATWHGLFTYTLYQVLSQVDTPITYVELLQQIHARYTQMGRTYPTPMLEGDGCHREVLGQTEWPERSQMVLSVSSEGTSEISAGAIHGVTAGSILAVYRPAGQSPADQVVGHVQVVSAGALTSQVVACEYGESPLTEDLPDQGRCEIVMEDYGLNALGLAVIYEEQEEPANDGVERSLTQLSEQIEGAFQIVARDEASWLIVVSDSQLRLEPASGWPEGAEPEDAESFGPISLESDWIGWLRLRLPRIARANNLLSLAAIEQREVARGISELDVQVELLRYDSASSDPREAISPGRAGHELQVGDIIGFRVTNTGETTVDVSLLYVDSGYGITAVYPRPGVSGDNRLAPGESLPVIRAAVSEEQFAAEHLIVLAVRGTSVSQPADFSFLEQPSIRDVRGEAESELQTPLGRCLETALYGQGSTRGPARGEVSEHAIRLLTWRASRSSGS